MAEIIKKHVCKCDSCGNEAEMVITCSLPEADKGSSKKIRRLLKKLRGLLSVHIAATKLTCGSISDCSCKGAQEQRLLCRRFSASIFYHLIQTGEQDLLKKQNHRMTRQRKIILEELKKVENPPKSR